MHAVPHCVHIRCQFSQHTADPGGAVNAAQGLLCCCTDAAQTSSVQADCADMYESYKQASYWDLIQKPPEGTVLNIVRAAKSDRYVLR